MKKKWLVVLFLIGLISVFFTVLQKTPTPPCFNADEAAFGYNAYSILETGKDEYGSFLPLRLKSFGDYKMPLYSYLSIPFIAIFGLNEFSARALNIVLSFFLPFAVYFFTKELFKDKKIALLSAFLTSVSLGLHLIARQAHEAYLAVFLTTLASFFFLKFVHKKSVGNGLLFSLSSLLLLFSYHPGRLFVFFFLGFAIILLFTERKKQMPTVLLLIAIIGLFGITDLVYKPERLKNLAFFNNSGFTLKTSELKIEGGIRYLYNPVFIGIKDIILDHLTYLSPQFLLVNGDANYRFGFPGMSIFTPVEFLFVLIGFYFLFKNKEKNGWFILSLLLVCPLSASLAWAKESLTRTLFLLVPLIILSSYGFIHLSSEIRKRKLYYLASFCIFCFFLLFSWDFYLFHYPKRLITIHSWQCGYKEVNNFIRENYPKYDAFYVTRDIGQPYIFSLFYLKYPPSKYQKEASLSASDEYGFGQVEQFDKFVFHFPSLNEAGKNSVLIGSIDNFKGIDKQIKEAKLDSQVQTISVNGEPMFQILTLPHQKK